MVLVDSSVWIDFFNGSVTPQCDALDALLGRELVLIGDLILTEVLQGFRTDSGYRQARTLLDPLTPDHPAAKIKNQKISAGSIRIFPSSLDKLGQYHGLQLGPARHPGQFLFPPAGEIFPGRGPAGNIGRLQVIQRGPYSSLDHQTACFR